LLELIGRGPRAARKADLLLTQFGFDQVAWQFAARVPEIDLKGERVPSRTAVEHPLQRGIGDEAVRG
jgi:hypothetical protein